MKIFSILIIFITFIYPQDKSPVSFNENSSRVWIENMMRFPRSSNLKIAYEENNPSRKKAGLAIIYSLLLPGMGELYAESYSSGKYFTMAEGALWGVYIGMNVYAGWQKDRYKSFAASNGGVNTAGKNDDFFSDISIYDNINDFNDAKALEGNFVAMYDPRQYYWSWSENDRKRYRSLWVSSEEAYNNIRFVVGALILNRIASAINAVRLVSAYNKKQSTDLGWNLSVGLIDQVNVPAGISFNFQTTF
jgi:hypothetical protein